MNSIVVTSTKQNIKFGYEGEDNVTKIIFPYDKSWLEYGEGNFEVRILRCGDEVAYTATEIVDDRQAMTLTMTVTDIELSVRGRGEMQLCYVCPDSIKKSPIYQYTVNRSVDYKYAVDPPEGSIIASVEKSLSEIKNTTNRLSNSVISIESSINDVNSQIDNINDKISEFDEEIDSIGEVETRVDNLETSVQSISGRINTAEGNINENTESISNLNESVTELENRKVTDLETSGGASDSGKYLTVDANGKVKATSLTIPTITVDASLSTTSTNPVQNKVIKTELNNINSNIETCNTEISKINGSLDDVKTDLTRQFVKTASNERASSGNTWTEFSLEVGHVYEFTNTSPSECTQFVRSVNSYGSYDYIETFVENLNINSKNPVVFSPTTSAAWLYVYMNGAGSFEIKEKTTLKSIYDEAVANENTDTVRHIENTMFSIAVSNGDSKVTFPCVWERGGIDLTNGADLAAKHRIRTGYYKAPCDMTVIAQTLRGATTGYIVVYDGSKTFLRTYKFTTSEGAVLISKSQYFRVFIFESGVDIGPENAASYVDVTLSNTVFTRNQDINSDIVMASLINYEDVTSEFSLLNNTACKGNVGSAIEFSSTGEFNSVKIANTDNVAVSFHTLSRSRSNGYVFYVDANDTIIKADYLPETAELNKRYYFVPNYPSGATAVYITSDKIIEGVGVAVYKKREEFGQPYDHIVKSINRIADNLTVPKQSIIGYKTAYKMGFRRFICDLQFSADGVPVCFHDYYFNEVYRMVKDSQGNWVPTDPPVYVTSLTWAELQTYDVGSYINNTFAGTRIMSLEQMYDLCKSLGCYVYIEVKKETLTTSELDTVFKIIRNYGMEDKTVWLASHNAVLSAVAQYEPNSVFLYQTGTVAPIQDSRLDEIIAVTNEYNFGKNEILIGVEPNSTITEQQIGKLSKAGIGTCAYLVSTTANIDALFAKGTQYHNIKSAVAETVIVGKYLYDKYMGYLN